MSGLFGSITIKGNRITDFAQQTGAVGIPIPFGYGIVPADGNLIWTTTVRTSVTKRKQGKGGVKTEEYTYRRSYAIAFLQAPIFGYLTIFRNGKVVYTTDPRTTVEDREYAQLWLENATLYLGGESQMPDPTIEMFEGVGNVSAFRDIAYIVLDDEDVSDNQGAVPSYQALCLASPPAIYMTSRPYAIEDRSSFMSVNFGRRNSHLLERSLDEMNVGLMLQGGELYGTLETYTNGLPDLLDASLTVLGGELYGTLSTYTNGIPDELDVSLQLMDGSLYGNLIAYDDGTPDEINTALEILGGTLS